MTAVTLAPVANIPQFFDNNGNPLAGGKIQWTVAGSGTTLQTTYSDSLGSVPNPNPVILDSSGRANTEFWLTTGQFYRATILNSSDVVLSYFDNVVGYGTSVSASTITSEVVTAAQGQTTVTLTNSYNLGSNAIEVMVNGAVQVPGLDYFEVTSTSILMATALNLGDIVHVRVFSVNPSAFTSAALVSDAGHTSVQAALDGLRSYDEANDNAYPVPQDFGAVANGITDDTAALKLFFDYCIDNNIDGYIPSGNYLVTTGVLRFDNGFTDKPWPNITGGSGITFTINQATKTDEPVIRITNGTANSQVGKYWRYGSIPSIKFVDVASGTAANRHCLQLTGMWGTKFGWMRGDNIRGSTIHIPFAQLGGTNPDPYSVGLCTFEGVEANFSARYAFENLNGTGWNISTIQNIRAIQTGLGGLFGFGAANTVVGASIGSVSGWAFDDGANSAITTSPNNFNLVYGEIDAPENGIRINKATASRIRARFAHRYQSGPDVYWPLQAMSVTGGASPQVLSGTYDLIHRVAAGGVKANVGKFFNGNNAGGNLVGVTVDTTLLDDAAFGFADSDLYTGVTLNSKILIRRSGIHIWNSIQQNIVHGVGDATTTINKSTFGTTGSKVTLPAELTDDHSIWTGGEATIVDGGIYAFTLRFLVALPLGTTVRLGVMRVRSGTPQAQAHSQQYAVTEGNQSYEISGFITTLPGDIIYPIAQNSTTGDVLTSVLVSQSADNCFMLHQL